jgi:hypothetical protein
MWFCFNDGFFSVVQDFQYDDVLVVRARRWKDIKKLFPTKKINITTETDYAFRVFISRAEWKKIMIEKIDSINYTNFKNSVMDYDLHEAYKEIWNICWYLQWNDKENNTIVNSKKKKRKKNYTTEDYAYDFNRLTEEEQNKIMEISGDEIERNRREFDMKSIGLGMKEETLGY